MSYLIRPGSTKVDRAIRFGNELELAMKARGVGRKILSQALGASSTSIMYWRSGRMLPRLETARRLSEALTWPRLLTLAAELRRKSCLVCATEFVDESGSDNRRYCSPSCQRLREKQIIATGLDRHQRAAIAERRLTVHQRAVAAFCDACEPGGRCVTPECELRPVSPLPLSDRRDEVEPVVARPRNGYRAPGQQAAITTRVWARYGPDERQARIDRAAQASKVARGLVS